VCRRYRQPPPASLSVDYDQEMPNQLGNLQGLDLRYDIHFRPAICPHTPARLRTCRQRPTPTLVLCIIHGCAVELRKPLALHTNCMEQLPPHPQTDHLMAFTPPLASRDALRVAEGKRPLSAASVRLNSAGRTDARAGGEEEFGHPGSPKVRVAYQGLC